MMASASGQYVTIITSHVFVIVRLGHFIQKFARDHIWKAQKMVAVKEEAERILNKHTVPDRWH